MTSQIWINVDACNGLLPGGIKPLPDPVLATVNIFFHSLEFIWNYRLQNVKLCSGFNVLNAMARVTSHSDSIIFISQFQRKAKVIEYFLTIFWGNLI